MGSISIRESIRWIPDEAAEPTSTIVLTSPRRRFVDLRILKGDNDSAPGEQLPLDRLDWAIAGTSSSWTLPNGVRHSQWEHWIDSRTLEPESATDEGDMHPLSDSLTLEKGSMVNPATGRETAYEEVWRDEEPTARLGDVTCLVVETEDKEENVRGRAVLLGGYVQALVRKGEEDVRLERWVWEGGEWKVAVRMGGEGLCEKVLAEGGGWKEGDEVVVGGDVWRVLEVVRG